MWRQLLEYRNDFTYKLCKGMATLDLGCGKGDFVARSSTFWGVDINDEMLAEAMKKAPRRIKKVDGRSLPFKDRIFDRVVMAQVLEHLQVEDAWKVLKEAARVLRKGGYLIVSTPVGDGIWNTFTHYRPYTPSSLRKITSESGGETLPKIRELKLKFYFYYGQPFGIPFLIYLTTPLAQLIPQLRTSYTAVLEKVL